MILITIFLLLVINIYGFIYSSFITKYNFLSSDKIQEKKIGYKVLLNRMPLITFNIFVLILLNVIGIKFFHHIFLKEFTSVFICFIEIV